jgi:ABC-type sulfate/molybdate transport systems ATPase subunit
LPSSRPRQYGSGSTRHSAGSLTSSSSLHVLHALDAAQRLLDRVVVLQLQGRLVQVRCAHEVLQPQRVLGAAHRLLEGRELLLADQLLLQRLDVTRRERAGLDLRQPIARLR